MSFTLALGLLLLLVIFALHIPPVASLPTNTMASAQLHHARSSSNKGPSGNPKIIIVAVLAGVLSVFAFFTIRGYLKRKKEKRAFTQYTGNEGPHRAPNHNNTINYTNIEGQADDSQAETREAEIRANGASARTMTQQPRVLRSPSRNSTRSLPTYKERLPDGEMVLVERVERPGMSENYGGYHSGDETESTPLTGATTSHAHTGATLTHEGPRVVFPTTNNRTEASSMSNVRSRHSQREDPRSREVTVSSVSTMKFEHIDARVSSVDRERGIEATVPLTYGNAPTYDDATALPTDRTVDAAESVPPCNGGQ